MLKLDGRWCEKVRGDSCNNWAHASSLSGSLKFIRSGIDRLGTCDFQLVICRNYRLTLYISEVNGDFMLKTIFHTHCNKRPVDSVSLLIL